MPTNPYLDLLKGGSTAPTKKVEPNPYLDLLLNRSENGVGENNGSGQSAPNTKQFPPSKSPFNPNTPGHDEYIKQIETRAPSTSVFKNFLPALNELGHQKSIIPTSPKKEKKNEGMVFVIGEGVEPNLLQLTKYGLDETATPEQKKAVIQEEFKSSPAMHIARDEYQFRKDKILGINAPAKDTRDHSLDTFGSGSGVEDGSMGKSGGNPAVAKFLNTFEIGTLPGKVLNLTKNNDIDYGIKRDIAEEYAKEHPVLSTVSNGMAQLYNLVLLRQMGAGFNLAPKVESSMQGLKLLSNPVTQFLAEGTENAAIFGLNDALSTSLDQAATRQFKPGEIIKNTLKGVGSGYAYAVGGGQKSLLGRIGATATGVSSFDLITQFIGERKITGKDLVTAGIDGLVAAIFRATEGTAKSRQLEKGQLDTLYREQSIVKMMDNGKTRAEAEALTDTIGQLDTAFMAGGGKAKYKIEQRISEIPESFKSLSTQEKVDVMAKVSENIKAGQPVDAAIKGALPPAISGEYAANVQKKQENSASYPLQVATAGLKSPALTAIAKQAGEMADSGDMEGLQAIQRQVEDVLAKTNKNSPIAKEAEILKKSLEQAIQKTIPAQLAPLASQAKNFESADSFLNFVYTELQKTGKISGTELDASSFNQVASPLNKTGTPTQSWDESIKKLWENATAGAERTAKVPAASENAATAEVQQTNAGPGQTLYHGTRMPIKQEKGLFSLTPDKNQAEQYANGLGGGREFGHETTSVFDVRNLETPAKEAPAESQKITDKKVTENLAPKVSVSDGTGGGGSEPAQATRSFKDNSPESRVWERLKSELPESMQEDLNYDPISLKQNAAAAVDLVATDKVAAYRIAMGVEAPPAGQTQTAVSIALAQAALDEKNYSLFAQVTKNRSLTQTRRGQEIVSEKGSVSNNDASRYVKELIKMRMEKVSKNYLSTLTDKLLRRNPVTQIIDDEVQKVKRTITKTKQMDIAEAQKFLDSLAC